jgi:NADH-quinone oxidoreductase subunit M
MHLPWLQLSIVIPLLGAIVAATTHESKSARRRSIVICLLTLACAVGAWADFSALNTFESRDRWDLLTWLLGTPLQVIDELSAPLLPLAALLYLLTVLSTQRTKLGRFSFSGTLVSEAILLATLSCRESWMLIGLLAASCVPPWLEVRARRHSPRVFEIHMGLSTFLLVVGSAGMGLSGSSGPAQVVAVLLLAMGALLRSGVVPVHCWITDLFEKATFGTALLFVTPLTGAYAVMRLVLPVAPPWILQFIAVMSLVTAVYAAGMALVQREARRFFCYLLLSHASLVLVGLELATPIGVTGGLCVWLSVGMSLAGFGLTLRSVEARIGRVLLTEYHGLFDQMPSLGGLFLLTGLSSIGFPGTVGFIGMELLVEGAADFSAWVGGLVVAAAALNGIAVLHSYFRVFTGIRPATTIGLSARPAERVAVLALAGLILGGGLIPQPGVRSRYHAVDALFRSRIAADAPRQVLTADRPDRRPIGETFITE